MTAALPTEVEMVLDGLKRAGDQWLAICPTHPDRNPSLALRMTEDGKLLVNCFAGCDPKGIMAAIGYEPPRPERRGEWTPNGEAIAVYDYCDEAGTLLFQVLRTADKHFSQRRPDPSAKSGWRYSLGDVRRVLYRLPQLIEAVANGQSVCVCYSGDTEVLTPTGWVRFPELAPSARVAQYDDGRVSFVSPLARQEFAYSGEMVSLAADWSGLLVTPDHRVLTRWRTSRPVVIPAASVGKARWLPVAGRRDGAPDGPTPPEARLLAAWQADGSNCRRGYRVGWNLRKLRKVERLRKLLADLGIEWREQQFASSPGWTYLTVDRREAPVLQRLVDKRFGWDLLDWPIESRQALLDELGYWDGDRPGREGVRFFTADHQNADVISAVAATSGWGSITRADDRQARPDQATQYVVSLVPRDWRQLGHEPVLQPYTGTKVYCLTVPSGFLVTRREGKVTICGNCEGEKDVQALVGAGFAATCNPGGAGKWRDEWAQHLAGANVTIFADKDTVGQAHARTVARSLSGIAASWKIVEAADPHKDISEHLSAGLPPSRVVVTASSAAPPTVDLAPDIRDLIDSPEPIYDWLIPGLLERGDRVILTGGEGTGKSMLIREWGVMGASGVHPATLAHIEPISVLVVDCENSRRQNRRKYAPILAAMRGLGREHEHGKLRIIHRPEGLALDRGEEDAAWLLERVTAHRPDLLLIGPLYQLHEGEPKDEGVARAVVRALNNVRVAADCAVILEAHSPHSENGRIRSVRPLGSSLYMRWPEFGLGLRLPRDAQGEEFVELAHWRGDRDERNWPPLLRRTGQLIPWEPSDWHIYHEMTDEQGPRALPGQFGTNE